MKYKTWEVIKMLTENQKLRFKLNDGYEIYASSGLLHLIHNGESIKINRNVRICDATFKADEWELVQEPVTFMEAINSNKKIKPVNAMTDYMDLSQLTEFMYGLNEVVLLKHLNGKWYIEE